MLCVVRRSASKLNHSYQSLYLPQSHLKLRASSSSSFNFISCCSNRLSFHSTSFSPDTDAATSTTTISSSASTQTSTPRSVPNDGLTLSHFLSSSSTSSSSSSSSSSPSSSSSLPDSSTSSYNPPLAHPFDPSSPPLPRPHLTYHIETYGCQMNNSDSEIVSSVLSSAGYRETPSPTSADVILLNTCAIREKAEERIVNRLKFLRSYKYPSHLVKNKMKGRGEWDEERPVPIVGVLGCMAERLKEKLLNAADGTVDLVVGPDSYRHIPSILSSIISLASSNPSTSPPSSSSVSSSLSSSAVSVQLSLEETYADITPVRSSSNRVTAYVSIMRGCDNMCSYCIVPFTRGRERSRDVESILREVRELSKAGYKEVVLLGQNVNSYMHIDKETSQEEKGLLKALKTKDAPVAGFTNISKRISSSSSSSSSSSFSPPSSITDFTRLLSLVSSIDPDLRIRFTSPHPKDFADSLLYLIRSRPNLCKCLHVPAQSGSSSVLERMRRGYSRESYMQLIEKMKRMLPNVSISTDMISGFCGENEVDHEETLSLMREVEYDQAFLFAYSQREKTHAHRAFVDDIPEEVKQKRLREVIETFRQTSVKNVARDVNTVQLVLVDGGSRRHESGFVSGRTDGNRRVIFQVQELKEYEGEGRKGERGEAKEPEMGMYVAVRITGGTAAAYTAEPLGFTTLTQFASLHPYDGSETFDDPDSGLLNDEALVAVTSAQTQHQQHASS